MNRWACKSPIRSSTMDKDRVKGAIKKAEGRIQKAGGDLTGSNEQKLKGTIKEAEGAAQENIGKAKDTIRKANQP
jgi:uncharacterized protein YjbJ (UPF0337 family)